MNDVASERFRRAPDRTEDLERLAGMSVLNGVAVRLESIGQQYAPGIT